MDYNKLEADFHLPVKFWKSEMLDTGFKLSKIDEEGNVEYFYDKLNKGFFNKFKFVLVKGNHMIELSPLDKFRLHKDLMTMAEYMIRHHAAVIGNNMRAIVQRAESEVNNNTIPKPAPPRQLETFDKNYGIEVTDNGISVKSKSGNIVIKNNDVYIDGNKVSLPTNNSIMGGSHNIVSHGGIRMTHAQYERMKARAKALKEGATSTSSRGRDLNNEIENDAARIKRILKRIKDGDNQ